MNARTEAATYRVVWEPSITQGWMISCPVFELLFGGARGPSPLLV
jgi:hypothetical protein